ncbi:MAG: 3-hydroxyacyl-[acyl-carrier-protein] dehydratase FabZ [Clostridiales bacterium 43-6]|nr:MAG: 3-hydroxyacyl-[acyl-carrier-protein] dehydratase FabZ [Clostridiales bacterium 43-6]
MLNKEQIKEIIPHRDPFLLIDEILELEPGKRAVGKKYVSEEEYYFKGHFPGQPVMPGVLIVESLAQVGAVSVLSLSEFKGKIAFFGGIKNARFRKVVRPGDELRLEVELVTLRSRIGIGQAKAYLGDDVACECEITFAIGKGE